MRVLFGYDVEANLLRLIDGAQQNLILVSPYLDSWQKLTFAIKRARARGVQVILILRGGSDKKKQSEKAKEFVQLGVIVKHVEYLHAKFYIADQKHAIVSSFNLLKSSASGSWEMSCVFNYEADTQAMKDLFLGFKELWERVETEDELSNQSIKTPSKSRQASSKKSSQGPQGTTKGRNLSQKKVKKTQNEGVCIRCSEDIKLNIERPFCYPCYKKWAEWEQEDYKEKFCHGCGKKMNTTKAKPFCRPCYKLHN